jgi:hypothetical protein
MILQKSKNLGGIFFIFVRYQIFFMILQKWNDLEKFLKIVLDFTRNKSYGGCPMKIQSTTHTIEQIGNISEESQFRMKASRKAFQILSDLYSDKPLAIVRELGANARDAMTAAGKGNQPFHVKVPNIVEPWIIIEDKGTGISHEDIYNVYATYFESTKSESNDFVGCLGLGSKSPFCYTDNFLVTSVHNGVKRIYNAFFNSNQTPAISLLSAENTDQDNGVAIQIPVNKNDIGNFLQAIKKAFRFYSIKPTITGGQIDWNKHDLLFSGTGWESYNGLEYGQSFAIMGGVSYPIDHYKIDHKNQSFIAKAGIVMYFEIGELDVAPSREALSYDHSTIDALNKKVEFIIKDFGEKFSENISNSKNLLEALKAGYSIRKKFSHLNLPAFDNMKWKGIDISNPSHVIHTISKGGEVLTHSYAKFGRSKYRQSATIALDSKWYVNDLEKGCMVRLKNHLKENMDDVITLFSKEAYDALVNNTDSNMTFDSSLFSKTSELAKPVKIQMPSVRGKNKVVAGFNVYQQGQSYRTSWDGKPFDPSNPPKFYVVKNNDSWNFNIKLPDLIAFQDKSDLKSLCSILKISFDDVVMVASQNVKKIAPFSQSLEDYAKANVKIGITSEDVSTDSHWSCRIAEFSKHTEFSKLDQESDLVKTIKKIAAIKNKMNCPANQSMKRFVSYKGESYVQAKEEKNQIILKLLNERYSNLSLDEVMILAKEI